VAVRSHKPAKDHRLGGPLPLNNEIFTAIHRPAARVSTDGFGLRIGKVLSNTLSIICAFKVFTHYPAPVNTNYLILSRKMSTGASSFKKYNCYIFITTFGSYPWVIAIIQF